MKYIAVVAALICILFEARYSYAQNGATDNQTIQLEQNDNITAPPVPVTVDNEQNSNIVEYNPIIEGAVSAGVMAFEQMSLDSSVAKSSGNFIPYGTIHLRFDNGKFLRPEIKIEESGGFNFTKSGITKGNKQSAYNNYYIKIPLGLKVPFFNYKSALGFDAKYSTMTNGIKLEKTTLVNNVFYNSGDKFSAISSEMTFRLYLNTPVVLEPSFFEHSYFGVFYSERVVPRTTSGPSGTENPPDLFIETVTRTGGLFYDMKKDAIVKGLNIGVAVYFGYGDMFNMDNIGLVGASFGNTKELITISASGSLGYRYVFSNNLGIDINAGVSYFVTTEFLGTPDQSQYSVNTGGDLRYYANLSFVFGY